MFLDKISNFKFDIIMNLLNIHPSQFIFFGGGGKGREANYVQRTKVNSPVLAKPLFETPITFEFKLRYCPIIP